jgi:hypothetical protein
MNLYPYRPEPLVHVERVHWAFRLGVIVNLLLTFLACSMCFKLARVMPLDHMALHAELAELHKSSTPPLVQYTSPTVYLSQNDFPKASWQLFVNPEDESLHVKGPHGHEFVFYDPRDPFMGGTFEVKGGFTANKDARLAGGR